MSVATELAERVKRLRVAHKMTMSQLADACEVTQSAIQSTESGNSSPGFMLLVRMARTFNVSLDYLCLGMVGQSFKHTQKELV